MDKIDLRSSNAEEIERLMANMGESNFRGKQVYQWLNKNLCSSFDEMTNISKNLREQLASESYISTVKTAERVISLSKDVVKYLFEMENNTIIESVFMKHEYGNTVCISTQAGCRMGCSFCASTIGGLDRNLTPGEMAGQVYEIQRQEGERISNLVLMGCGEPFDNYDNVMKFIEIINSKDGLNIGYRNITVSTCGLVEKIYDFAHEGTQVNLAVSLHAPNDEIRRKIMPIANKYSVDEILEACKYYCNKTKRRVTYEYALIKGVNDSTHLAEELGQRLRHSLCHVNLIPVNNIAEKDYQGSQKQSVDAFSAALKSYGIETTTRRRLGKDIDAACGQLRKKYLYKV